MADLTLRLPAMNPDDLARLLADRLQKLVPHGFHVDAADGLLWFSSDEGRFPGQTNNYRVGRFGMHVRDSFPLHGDTLEDHIVGVSRQAPDDLQDYVDEAAHDPWPGRVRPPEARAEIRDSRLRLWFDDSGAVVAECEPIQLDHL
jgi:hypothetical protein